MTDYVKLHKELWTTLASPELEGVIAYYAKTKIVVTICNREDIPLPPNYCFLCAETLKHRQSVDCRRCKGKWPKGHCDQGGLFTVWCDLSFSTDHEGCRQAREIALKIANICD